jgi:glycosyltransferase involved in cell wall biosynthesis
VRVCFVSRRFFPAISGMSVYAVNLLRELVAQGHDVTMVSQYRGDERGTRVYGGGPPPPVPGVKVIGLEALGEQDGGDFERDVATMADVVAAEHARAPFDVLHAQYGYPTGFAVLEASRRLGVPNVVSIQGGDGHWVGSCCETHRRAMVAVLDHAGEVLIGSPTFAQEVTDRLGTDPARFTIVPGAVDTTRFRPGPAGTEGDPTLLYHGRVDRRKGILDLLDALDRLDRPADLVVSGIGPDLDAARERAEGDDRVRFTGYAGYDAAPDVYRHGGVFVSPTYAEGFSNTILEAMASGLPVVSTRAVGVLDCVRDGENGLLVEPGDVDALAGALDRVLGDRALRERLAATALAEVRATYAWPRVAGLIAGAYERVRGTAPDDAWLTRFPPAPPAPCRFRAEPHLL